MERGSLKGILVAQALEDPKGGVVQGGEATREPWGTLGKLREL